jgi:tetraprenyl-beta-curcumene synthase
LTRCQEGFAFVSAARCYRFEILPEVRRQRRRWRERAAAIPDPGLRRGALHTIDQKWGHSEGAAAFAVLVARKDRPAFVRMAIAYEVLIDYLDTISEQPVSDPWANTLQLHRAATNAVAFEPAREPDYYMFHPRREDGGFLPALVGAVRDGLVGLPSWSAVSERAELFASLYAEAQAQCHVEQAGGAPSGSTTAIDAMANRHDELSWDEVRAACSTSIPLFALMALATRSECSAAEVERWASAYFPWPACLHILLHSLADEEDDRAAGCFNQLGHYRSRREAGGALASIAFRAREELAQLAADTHLTIYGGMVGYYLACPQVWEEQNRPIAELVLKASGPSARWAMLTHRHRLAGGRA